MRSVNKSERKRRKRIVNNEHKGEIKVEKQKLEKKDQQDEI